MTPGGPSLGQTSRKTATSYRREPYSTATGQSTKYQQQQQQQKQKPRPKVQSHPPFRLAAAATTTAAATPLLPLLASRPAAARATAVAMSVAMSETALRAVISRVAPDAAAVKHLGVLPPVKLQRSYGVTLTDGSSLVIVVPPHPMVRLLRCEQLSTNSEAALLRFLAEAPPSSSLALLSEEEEHRPRNSSTRPTTSTVTSTALLGKPASGTIVTAAEAAESEPRIRTSSTTTGLDESSSLTHRTTLRRFVPALVSHCPPTIHLGMEHNVIRPTTGEPIASLVPPPTSQERRAIDRQIGELCRCISRVTSPSSKFGPAVVVLSATSPRTVPLGYFRGFCTWSEAFHHQLENILRDGEDMAITLAYSAIRRHFMRFAHLLDAVTTPRLVVLDAWEDANVLVQRTTADGTNKRGAAKTKAESQSKAETITGGGGAGATKPRNEASVVPVSSLEDRPRVMGLRDWSSSIFGDPLLLAALSSEPTDDFLAGFNFQDHDVDEPVGTAVDGDLIEDRAHAATRLLLYQCYHAAMGVIKEFYRPLPNSSTRELAARKKLNEALMQLAEIDDLGTPRRRRPSGELSPAKRTKQNEQEEASE